MHFFRRASEPMLVFAATLIGSLAFLLAGPYSNFAPVGFLDPWYYTGYFLHFRYLVHHYGPTYYVSRLPWILPGVAAFHIASPEVASVLLNLAIATASAVSLYWSVRWFYGAPAGAAAAALLVTNPFFMSTITWDYPDGAAIAYAFAALAFAVRPTGKRAVNSLLVGVFLALTGLTHLAAGSMILAVVAIPLWRQRHAAREILRECGYIGSGVAAAVLALCPVSQAIFGRWTYFYWQIYYAIETMRQPHDLLQTWGTGPEFLLAAYRFFAPALLLLFGPIFLARLHKPDSIAWLAWIALLICMSLYTFEEFVLHSVSLRVHYQSSYLVVPLFFFAGSLLGEYLTSWWRAALVTAAAAALPFSYPLWAWPPHPWPILFVIGAIATLALLFRQLPLGAFALAAVLFVSPAVDRSCDYVWDRPTPAQGRSVDAFQSLMTLENSLRSSVDPSRRLRFWFDRDEPPWTFYDSAESLYLWIPADFTRDLASWPEAELQHQVPSNTTFAHLTVHPERVPQRSLLLSTRDIHIANERRWTMPYRGNTIYVVLQDVEDTHAE